jgi:MFS family permease
VISVLGGAMSLVALPWFVFENTRSAALTGIAAVCETAPVVVVSIAAGAIVARVGARPARVWSDMVAGVAMVAVPVLHATVGVAYWQLLLLVAVNGALRTPAVVASMVMLLDVTNLAGLNSDQTAGPYAASVRLAATVGAPAAGTLIAFVGAPAVLVVDAATFLISATLVLLLVPAAPARRPVVATDPDAATQDSSKVSLTAGFKMLCADRVLMTLTLFAVVLAVMTGGWNSVAAPIYGRNVLSSPVQLGMVLGLFGAGALLGNLIYAPLSRTLSRYTLLIAALTLAGPLPWVGLALDPPLVILLATMALAGVGLGVLSPFYLTLQYERVPRDCQAHLFALTFGLQTAGEVLGAGLAALTFTYFSIEHTLLGMGLSTAPLVLAAVLTPSLKVLRNRRLRTTERPANLDHT